MANKPIIADKSLGEEVTHTEFNTLKNFFEQKVDVVAGKQLSSQDYTLDEKNKLAGLESSKFQGIYTDLSELNAADVGGEGHFAYVDAGVGESTVTYIWDNSDNEWVLQVGNSSTDTAAVVKSKYESNPDTNAFTDADKANLGLNTDAKHSHSNKSILDAIQQALTTALKTAYDGATTWIATNGAAILAHISSNTNPHGVTKTQVGLSNVNNTSDADKPVSTAQSSALALKSNLVSSIGLAVHEGNASMARPEGYGVVMWIGSVEPINAANYDLFISTVS